MNNKKKLEILELPLFALTRYFLAIAAAWVVLRYLFGYGLHYFSGYDKPSIDVSPIAIAFIAGTLVALVYNSIAKLFGGVTVVVAEKSEQSRNGNTEKSL